MDVESKIKEDMSSLGCKSEKKISLAYHLYVYLIDEKLMYDCEYCYNRDIETLYVVARRNKNDKLNIYVPVATHDDVTMHLINELQVNLCTVETGPMINLAFIDGDFTTVIYSFIKGIVARTNSEKQNKREEKRSFINNELKKKRNEILNEALNGVVVDD